MLKLKKNRAAFSLLELILAIAILSSGIVVVLQALTFSVRLTGLSCDMARASFLALDKMQELEFKEKRGMIKNEPAQAQGEASKFRWEYTLNQEPASLLYKLKFNISWMSARKEADIPLETYLR